MDDGIADEVDVLRALAHPVRWGILQRLAAEPGICACDFTEFFDVSQPTISAHLKVLREAGLVTSKRIGTTICYSIAPGQLTSLGARLTQMAATADEGRGRPSPRKHSDDAGYRFAAMITKSFSLAKDNSLIGAKILRDHRAICEVGGRVR